MLLDGSGDDAAPAVVASVDWSYLDVCASARVDDLQNNRHVCLDTAPHSPDDHGTVLYQWSSYDRRHTAPPPPLPPPNHPSGGAFPRGLKRHSISGRLCLASDAG